MIIPQEQDFAKAVTLWREWNGKINVVSRKDEEGIFAHHILHSLAIAEYLDIYYPSARSRWAGRSTPKIGRFSGTPESDPQGADHPGIAPPKADAQIDFETIQQPNAAIMEECCRCPENMDTCSENPGKMLQVSRKMGDLQHFGPSRSGDSFLDVGTGGGFPGIPLAMVMPQSSFTLCDSIGKKIKVAQAVADGLGLRNVECVNARVENLKGEWDWVVSRAVTSLDNFYPWVRGRFRKSILYLKGGDVDAEIGLLCKKYRIPEANIRCWRVDSWLKDEYFAEKFVIEIGKNYLCTPNFEKLKD